MPIGELLPCPFCGSAPVVVDDNSYGDCQILCNCDHEPSVTAFKENMAEAIVRWNRRADLARLTEEKEAQKKKLEVFQPFWEKYALGSKLPPSCLCCGKEVRGRPAVQHMELSGIVVCADCKSAAEENEALRKERDNALRERASYPACCPITQEPFFMTIEHPEDGWVPTYGGPFDSYTIPTWEGEQGKAWHEGEFTRHRYDHDAGGWTDDESLSIRIIDDETLFALEDAAIKEGS